MGTESKHAYRFGYLKSEKWKTVRLEAIARDRGMCQFCGKEAGSMADAHHAFYPKSFWETKPHHLLTLCRECHEYVHDNLPKSFSKLNQAWRAFLRLKKKSKSDREIESVRMEESQNSKCWFCRKTALDLVRFHSPNPRFFAFHPKVCAPCSVIITEKTFGVDFPFKVIRSLRTKGS